MLDSIYMKILACIEASGEGRFGDSECIIKIVRDIRWAWCKVAQSRFKTGPRFSVFKFYENRFSASETDLFYR